MEVDRADPRDQRWEVSRPTYRVYFWSNTRRSACQEFELIGADSVHDVFRWADEQTSEGPLEGWLPEVWLRVDDRVDGLGLIRLSGPEFED